MNGVMLVWALLLCALAWPVQAQTVRYIHTDALGSVVAVTDANRAVIERREYEPYGTQLTPAVADGPGYTGHVQDAATGLVYAQQRYYDPFLGRFLSVDPVTANSGTGANFNRYQYANNNPYKFTDPDGRIPGIARIGDSCNFAWCRQQRQDHRKLGHHGFAAGNNEGQEEVQRLREARGATTRTAEEQEEILTYAAEEAVWMLPVGRLLGGIGRFFKIGSDARKIAAGHAFTKHAREFGRLGIRTERQFARHIDNVMANPTAKRNLERGRTAFWDQRTGTVVIRDPRSPDGGTAFVPTRGVDYFNSLR